MSAPRRRGAPPAAPRPEDVALFREEMRDVLPVPPDNRMAPYRAPAPPVASKRLEDERLVLSELSRFVDVPDDVEIEEDRVYLRTGLPRDILRKLRRRFWVVQDELDLHGLNAETAALRTVDFLVRCRREGLRCVRIVHGKGRGSPQREPVLKHRVRRQLQRRAEVLAYVEPREVDGGGGAVIVLLSA